MREDSIIRCGLALVFLWALLFAVLAGGAALSERETAAAERDTEAPGEAAGRNDEEKAFLPDWSDFAGRETSAAGILPSSVEPIREEEELLSRFRTAEREVEVFRAETGTAERMPLEEYVLGVLSAEMPLSFGAEALKAQAAAIRTVVLYQLSVGRKHGKTGAAVCDDYRHCMAFLPPAEGNETFGSVYMDGLRAAVKATEGRILTYDGEPIAAMFHSSSHGRTEDAEAVLGYAVPCLVSVTSWEDDRISTVSLPFSAFRSVFTERTDIPLGSLSIVRDDAGRAETVSAFGTVLTGTEFRARTGIASADFEITADGETARIVSHGSGHGIGLSQYGAARMAEWGYSYEEILTHYYPGARLTDLNGL